MEITPLGVVSWLLYIFYSLRFLVSWGYVMFCVIHCGEYITEWRVSALLKRWFACVILF